MIYMIFKSNMLRYESIKECHNVKIILMLLVVIYHCIVFWGGYRGLQIIQPSLLQRPDLLQNGWEVFMFLHLLLFQDIYFIIFRWRSTITPALSDLFIRNFIGFSLLPLRWVSYGWHHWRICLFHSPLRNWWRSIYFYISLLSFGFWGCFLSALYWRGF